MILNAATNTTNSTVMRPIVRSHRFISQSTSARSISLWFLSMTAAVGFSQLSNIQRATAEVVSPRINSAETRLAQQVNQLLETGKCPSCNLAGADLREAHLIGADLRNASLEGADLTGANLEGADLTGATLKNANLTEVMLSNADLRYSDLTNANLERSIAYNADTRGATLVNLNLADAKIWNSGISVGGDEPIK